MTWRSHALIGINALWLIAPIPQGITGSNVGIMAISAVFGALLPDLDAAESKLKHLRIGPVKPFALLATSLHRALGHRGLLHSIYGLSAVMMLVLVPALWGWQIPLAILLGFASHLLADACTPSGIPLLHPNPRRYHFLPPALRIVTGSPREESLLPLLIAGTAALLLSRLPLAQ